MKRMGFYVNCLSAEILTDPFFHRAGGFGTCYTMVCFCVYFYVYVNALSAC